MNTNKSSGAITPSMKLEEEFAVVFDDVPIEYSADKGQEVICNDPESQ